MRVSNYAAAFQMGSRNCSIKILTLANARWISSEVYPEVLFACSMLRLLS